jgi:hypothetical protein
MVTTFAAQMTALDQGAELVWVMADEIIDEHLGLVEAIQRPQFTHPFQPKADGFGSTAAAASNASAAPV